MRFDQGARAHQADAEREKCDVLLFKGEATYRLSSASDWLRGLSALAFKS